MRVFVFGGTGGPGALRRALARGGPEGARILEEASDAVAIDLRARLGVVEQATSERDAQLSTFLAGHIDLDALRRAGREARWSLGYGLGEYNHLVHIGALDLVDAVRLVDARGRAFDRGPEGAMLVANGVDTATVRRVIEEITGIVEISGYDGPTSHVLAGERSAVRMAKLKLVHEHRARCAMLPQRLPVHCDLFEAVGEWLEPALWRTSWRSPRGAYFPNVRGEPVIDASALDFVAALRAQVHRPVLWADSLAWTTRNLPEAELVRVGASRSKPVVDHEHQAKVQV